MSKRFKIAATAAIAAGLLAGTAATASAHTVGGTPTPSPSPSQQTVTPTVTPYPTHHGHVRPALWQFDFTGANIDGLQLNDVRGVGAIPFTRWQERDLSPFTSKFFSPVSSNSVTLRHNRLPLPDFNLGTCTATFDQVGHFRIVAGTGIGANLRVVPFTDRYILRGLISFDRIQVRYRSVCPLQFVSPWTLRNLVEANNLNLGGLRCYGQLPSLVDFDVQGNALLVRINPLPVPSPTPTGPGHFFAPTVSPSETISA
jgi:hypothetical protein